MHFDSIRQPLKSETTHRDPNGGFSALTSWTDDAVRDAVALCVSSDSISLSSMEDDRMCENGGSETILSSTVERKVAAMKPNDFDT